MDPATFQKLDRLIHERGRLGIVSSLAPVDSLTFRELRDLLEMTDGNLSVHMRVLEDNHYVSVAKDFVDRKPRTTYSLTAQGRRAFQDYISALEEIVSQSRPLVRGAEPEPGPPEKAPPRKEVIPLGGNRPRPATE